MVMVTRTTLVCPTHVFLIVLVIFACTRLSDKETDAHSRISMPPRDP